MKFEQRNCKNCGAPLEHSYNHKCSHCGTLYDFNEKDYKEIKPENLCDLKLYSIERDPWTNNYHFIFRGFIKQNPKIYEYDGKNTWTTNVIEYKYENIKEGFILIEVPEYELRQSNYNIGFLYSLLASNGIYFEEHKHLEESIIDKMKGYMIAW